MQQTMGLMERIRRVPSGIREARPRTALQEAKRMGLEKVATINGLHFYHVGAEHGWAENEMFQRFHRDVYTKSIAPGEAIPMEAFLQLNEARKAGQIGAGLHGMVAFNRKGELVGGGSGVYLHGAKAGFIGYNAISREHRGGGAGTAMNEAFKKLFFKKYKGTRWILGESDVLPQEHKLNGETVERYQQYGNPWDRVRWKAQKLGRKLLRLPTGGQYMQPEMKSMEMEKTPLNLHVELFHEGGRPRAVEGFHELVPRRQGETEEQYQDRVHRHATDMTLNLMHSIYGELPPYHFGFQNQTTRTRLIAQALGVRPRDIGQNAQGKVNYDLLRRQGGFGLENPLIELNASQQHQYQQFLQMRRAA